MNKLTKKITAAATGTNVCLSLHHYVCPVQRPMQLQDFCSSRTFIPIMKVEDYLLLALDYLVLDFKKGWAGGLFLQLVVSSCPYRKDELWNRVGKSRELERRRW